MDNSEPKKRLVIGRWPSNTNDRSGRSYVTDYVRPSIAFELLDLCKRKLRFLKHGPTCCLAYLQLNIGGQPRELSLLGRQHNA